MYRPASLPAPAGTFPPDQSARRRELRTLVALLFAVAIVAAGLSSAATAVIVDGEWPTVTPAPIATTAGSSRMLTSSKGRPR